MCAEILGSYVPDYDMELLYRSQNYLADKYMADVDRWGEMNDEVWDRYTQFLVDYDVIDEAHRRRGLLHQRIFAGGPDRP